MLDDPTGRLTSYMVSRPVDSSMESMDWLTGPVWHGEPVDYVCDPSYGTAAAYGTGQVVVSAISMLAEMELN